MKKLIPILCLLSPAGVKAQSAGAVTENKSIPDSAALFTKANSVQIVNYTPKPGKEGKDVSFLFELLSLGRLNKNGKDGNNGPDLIVLLKKLNLYGQTLLKIIIPGPDSSHNAIYYVNPVIGQIKIITDGSDGGKGGVSPKGFRGDPGKAGRGGRVTVLVDSSSAAYMRCTCLVFSNNDGNGIDKSWKPEDELLLSNGQLLQPFNKTPEWKLVKLPPE